MAWKVCKSSFLRQTKR